MPRASKIPRALSAGSTGPVDQKLRVGAMVNAFGQAQNSRLALAMGYLAH
jgi:hypothetical protein